MCRPAANASRFGPTRDAAGQPPERLHHVSYLLVHGVDTCGLSVGTRLPVRRTWCDSSGQRWPYRILLAPAERDLVLTEMRASSPRCSRLPKAS